MSLELQINKKIKDAMRSRNQIELDTLRSIKAAILLEKTQKGALEILEKSKELKILQKLHKQRKESADVFNKQNRPDLAEQELLQAVIIEQYLPEQISEEELITIIKDIISQAGGKSMNDMGKIMGLATSKLAGKADGKTISNIVRNLLIS